MLKKAITYTDFNDVEHTEDFYFSLSKGELIEMQLSVEGGWDQWMQKIINAGDNVTASEVFTKLILKSYGEKSDDGKRFIKSPEKSEEFHQTNAYSELLFELMRDENEAAAFVTGILPKDLREIAANATDTGTTNVAQPVLASAV